MLPPKQVDAPQLLLRNRQRRPEVDQQARMSVPDGVKPTSRDLERIQDRPEFSLHHLVCANAIGFHCFFIDIHLH
jgi:hypothetical protein